MKAVFTAITLGPCILNHADMNAADLIACPLLIQYLQLDLNICEVALAIASRVPGGSFQFGHSLIAYPEAMGEYKTTLTKLRILLIEKLAKRVYNCMRSIGGGRSLLPGVEF